MNSLAVLESSELVATIERARAHLDAGDVQAALMLSSAAYAQAKAAGGYASRVKVSRDLIDKAKRMQADALKIESICYCRMADAVDEAQAKGAISKGGRPKTISDDKGFRLEDVGLDSQRLHAARQIRDAERAEPGFIDRVVEARIEEGLDPSRASVKNAAGHAIGTKTATKDERGDDLYETPIEAMRVLLALESFGLGVVEPSVGRGAILRPLEAAGYEVAISDLVDRGTVTQHGEPQGVGDFLLSQGPSALWSHGPDIVTNPPYGVANAYIAHAIRTHRPGKIAMLLNLNFLAGFDDADRCFVMDENPPSRIYVFTRRLPMMHRDGWEGNKASSQMNTAWFIWERNLDGSYGQGFPEVIRIDWKRFETAEPLAPGEGTHVSPLTFAEAEEDFTRTTQRKTLDERVSEVMDAALGWIRDTPATFEARDLRIAIGVRDSTACEIINRLAGEGRVHRLEDGWAWAGDAHKAVAA
ncbi:hypothetical protein [Rhizobium wuzhouense]|uniref:hypothetical protein n=1 Tax=Rhizobium wuzhouense TaxID=1986026 RepID=UPI00197E56A4|nr:hypothetical protein [Rhizobium wuzhouense]